MFDFLLYGETARNPIGIRPLYYGYLRDGTIVFASEPKNLVGLVAGRIMPFPPGKYYYKGKFHTYCDIADVGEYVRGDPDEVCASIRDKLIAGIRKRLDSDAPLGFCFRADLTARSSVPSARGFWKNPCAPLRSVCARTPSI